MFIVELTYKAELADIDAAMKPHMAYLNRHYASGRFVMSGRKVPRDGGVILVNGDDREEVEALVREDPFVSRGLADFRLIQFRVSQRAKSIEPSLE